jgi:hypothetical protein
MNRPRIRSSALVCLMCAVSISASAIPIRADQKPARLPHSEIEKKIKQMAKEAQPENDLRQYMENLKTIDEMKGQLADYCVANPNDMEAVTLMMNLYEVNQMYGVAAKPGETPAEQKQRYTDPYCRVVDGALGREPENPELHYWRGRLYAFSEPMLNEAGIDTVHSQMPRAILEMQRAVELDPKNDHYRESLGVFQCLAGNEAAGMKELQALSGGKHPVYVLLHDWSEIGVPEQLAFDARWTATVIDLLKSSGLSYALWRVRAFNFAGSLSELEGHCQESWPGFKLVANGSAPEPERERGSQVLLWKGGAITSGPANFKDIEEIGEKMEFDGFLVSAIQAVADSTAVRRNKSLREGDIYCDITLINCRKVKSR